MLQTFDDVNMMIVFIKLLPSLQISWMTNADSRRVVAYAKPVSEVPSPKKSVDLGRHFGPTWLKWINKNATVSYSERESCA